jgi:endonuclease/exonuclease/phosphatase family protein
MRRLLLTVAVVALAAAAVPAAAAPAGAAQPPVRFATFNASLNRNTAGELRADLLAALDGTVDPQLGAVLRIIEINDPDVLLINEFDYEPGNAALFAELAGYPYSFEAPSNTGIPSGFDLNNNGVVFGGDDAFGFGAFPGQFGMAVFSRFPIDTDDVRTFQLFRWADMPGARLPVNPDGTSFYSPEELAVFRLSSKSHWDVPIEVGSGRNGKVVHFLVSHPTPPVFDGPEDRNGTRNADEIRFWADYISPATSDYIYDDAGGTGGLRPGAPFVIAGDQNSDPNDGDSLPGSIQQLLDSPRVNTSVTPDSAGAVEATALQGGVNVGHVSDPRFDTADFADTPGQAGNLRADYVLPSKNLRIEDAGVFWPVQADPDSALTGVFPFPSSDHRLVFVDVRVPGR